MAMFGRNTYGQILTSILGKSAACLEKQIYRTPFNEDTTQEELTKLIE
jgi:DNA-directed RNA polymerase beta subunit